MSCRVSHVNKKTGVTYVYESVSHWDKEKRKRQFLHVPAELAWRAGVAELGQAS